jgi:hypothetical protein
MNLCSQYLFALQIFFAKETSAPLPQEEDIPLKDAA